MFKAVVCDLDGTLLNDEGRLSHYTSSTLERLNRSGIKVVIATGRFDLDARRVLTDLNFCPTIVSCNGAMVRKDLTSTPFSLDHLPTSISAEIINELKDSDVHITLFSEQGWHMFSPNKYFDEYIEDSGLICDHLPVDELLQKTAIKLLLQGEESEINRLKKSIDSRYGKFINSSKSSFCTLDLVSHGLSKADAIKRYLSQYNITIGESIAFGDAMNDLEMLQQSGKGVVMGNAITELAVTLASNPKTESNQADGVAKYLDKVFPVHQQERVLLEV
jgi:HMP-PP phosphatase